MKFLLCSDHSLTPQPHGNKFVFSKQGGRHNSVDLSLCFFGFGSTAPIPSQARARPFVAFIPLLETFKAQQEDSFLGGRLVIRQDPVRTQQQSLAPVSTRPTPVCPLHRLCLSIPPSDPLTIHHCSNFRTPRSQLHVLEDAQGHFPDLPF